MFIRKNYTNERFYYYYSLFLNNIIVNIFLIIPMIIVPYTFIKTYFSYLELYKKKKNTMNHNDIFGIIVILYILVYSHFLNCLSMQPNKITNIIIWFYYYYVY